MTMQVHVVFDQMPSSSGTQSHQTSEMQEPNQQVLQRRCFTAVRGHVAESILQRGCEHHSCQA